MDKQMIANAIFDVRFLEGDIWVSRGEEVREFLLRSLDGQPNVASTYEAIGKEAVRACIEQGAAPSMPEEPGFVKALRTTGIGVHWCEDILGYIDSLRAVAQSAVEDAERYRWLRDKASDHYDWRGTLKVSLPEFVVSAINDRNPRVALDAAIDQAIRDAARRGRGK